MVATVSIGTCLFLSSVVSAQEPAFAGIFGADPLDIVNPNSPSGALYEMLLHDADDNAVYDDLEYDPARGYGFEVITGATNDDRFGPFDNSPNRRGDFDPIEPDVLYNSFIGFKSHPETCDEFLTGDFNTPCSEFIDPSGGIFRMDVPNGDYRFVGVFGDADNVHAHRVLAEDGGSGPPTDIGPNHVVLVGNHDQAQFEIGETEPAEPGEGVYALVAFDDKRPPEAQGGILPAFVPYDENGEPLVDADNFPTGAPPNSPTLTVTQGYIRLHLLQGNSNDGFGGPRDPNGADIVLFEAWPSGDAEPQLQPGDANQDFSFDQLDIVQVSVAAKYLSGQPATWGEGDWNGAPGGSQGNPPAGNGFFDQVDIIAALSAGHYLQGPYAALAPGGVEDDEQTSLVYDPTSGNLSVDAPASTELTSIFVTSASNAFIGDKPAVLDGPFDSFAADNIFKSTIGSSFGDIDFGAVLPAGMAQDAVLSDLTASGSLDGGGGLGDVDLIYVPEPASVMLLLVGFAGLLVARRRSR